jgi:hypothetical protein
VIGRWMMAVLYRQPVPKAGGAPFVKTAWRGSPV